MTYTITKNPQFDSLEITFDGKPSEEIRNALKALKFRWHNAKKVWYGFSTEDEARMAIDCADIIEIIPDTKTERKPKAEKANKYGVKVGDIFSASWGWEQTNNDFFQVVELVGESSVRVREVYLPCIESSVVSPMSEDRTFQLTRELLPAASSSVFIDNQERGDLKRLTPTYYGDSVKFKLASFTSAYLCKGDTIKVYESWYA